MSHTTTAPVSTSPQALSAYETLYQICLEKPQPPVQNKPAQEPQLRTVVRRRYRRTVTR